jgi:hypothetical protein
VTEQLSLGSLALTALATDCRKLLFPEASDAQFADGYAQAITFGMLMEREIRLSEGLDTALRMFVTDTLGNPYVEQEWVPAILGPIAESRRQANEIKR